LSSAECVVTLNPPMDMVIATDMNAMLTAEYDDAIEIRERARSDGPVLTPAPAASVARPVRTLMLGWYRRRPMIALELSRYLAPCSLLTIAADTPELEADYERLVLAGDNLRVELKLIDTNRRGDIEALDPADYDHILVLGFSDLLA